MKTRSIDESLKIYGLSSSASVWFNRDASETPPEGVVRILWKMLPLPNIGEHPTLHKIFYRSR